MANILLYEDVDVDTEITPLVKNPTTQQLVRWAGASGDFYQIHYDKDFALGNNLPGVLVHGPLKSAWLGQMLGDWVGESGFVKTYNCSHRVMDLAGEPITCKGRVTSKYIDGNDHLVECDIWIENSRGEKTAPGTAVVVLPSRS